MQPSSRRRQPARHELPGQGGGESMEDEAERLEILDRGFDREGEAETLGGPARPERLEFLAMRPGVDPGAFLAETGDERGPVEFGDGPDPAQAEAGQPGPDIGILGEQAGRVRGEERRLATGRDEDRRRRGGRGPRPRSR